MALYGWRFTLMAFGVVAGATLARAESTNIDMAMADPDIQVQAGRTGLHVIPGASVPKGAHLAHSNMQILVPYGEPMGTGAPGVGGETPASLACVYGIAPHVVGCNPQTVTAVATGGSRAIAIVDAFDYPTAAQDLATFSRQFGLPAPKLRVIYASGSRPGQDISGGWELEASLDIEMAHALAPNAEIILVEAASNSDQDLYGAEHVALAAVAQAGGGEVSNSWAAGEWPSEAAREADMTATGVVVFAAAGDHPGVSMPAVLSNVISVGGSQINRDGQGNFISQTVWSSTGGGISAFLPRPSYQNGVAGVVGTRRGTPDIAMVGSGESPVWIYDSTPFYGRPLNWTRIAGTSVATPLAAAMVNHAGSFRAGTTAELTEMYTFRANKNAFTDITSGTCRNTMSGTASVGYDLCTGIGALFGRVDK